MKKRELWLDYIRAIACFMVAFIHFVESMQQAGIIASGAFFRGVETMIYFIPVPVFFFCSGYLYQAGKPIENMGAYLTNIKNKLIDLGIPYVFFILVTVVMKMMMADSVNTPVDKSIMEYIFLSPPGQMWYLIVLLLCFLLIPTLNSNNCVWIAGGACICLAFALTGIPHKWQIVEGEFFRYVIWFVGGMLLQYTRKSPNKRWIAVGALLVPVMICNYCYDGYSFVLQSLESLFGIVLLAGVCVCMKGKHSVLILLSKYMLQIYLLHTMCAALVRIVLMKMQIFSAPIHIVLGLTASYVGPIVIAIILEKTVIGNIIFFPRRTLDILLRRK